MRQSSSQRREERRGSEDRYKPSSSSSRRYDDRYKDDRYKESSSRRHHSSSKDKKTSSSSSRRSKKGPPLDTIDRLDVTGFFGPGNFHHDGPFDACTPHRNKQNNKKAPVAAFPIDGANNTVTGVDPNRDRYANENQIMGRGDSEAFQDFSMPLRGGGTLGRSHDDSSTFDASLNQKPVHGNTSLGLGSSTFLDGAPASKTATDKFNQEQQQLGLSRKKSLAQRFRGGNGAGPAVSRDTKVQISTSTTIPATGRTASPTSPVDGYSSPDAFSPEQAQSHPKSNGLLRRVKSLKVGSSRR